MLLARLLAPRQKSFRRDPHRLFGQPLALPYFLESSRGLEIIGFLFWIWMIYECATRERNSTEKILWLLLVIFAPVLGSLIYFLIRVVKIRR